MSFRAFYTDGCKAYYNAIREIFGVLIPIQYDYFHIIQNAWRHLWKWSVSHRRDVKSRSEKVKSKWYKRKLEALATSLWKNRYLLFNFLEGHFEWMTAFLRHENVKRNSLSETGMRILRRLELEHDGFRSEKGREDFLRIYQAIKYLDWNVHRGPPEKA